MTTTKRIVFIGAAGEMCRVAIERFAKAAGDGDWKLELYDIRPETLQDFVKRLPSGSATVGSFDLFDRVRSVGPLGRLYYLMRSGAYRQTSLDQLGLYAAAIMGKI